MEGASPEVKSLWPKIFRSNQVLLYQVTFHRSAILPGPGRASRVELQQI